jgi:hypothetical protein
MTGETMAQIPGAVGLFVCEQVIIEERTRNVTPVNCFSHRAVRRFPSEPFTFAVVAVLRDGSGKVRLDLAIDRLATVDTIYQRSITAQFTDQMQELLCFFRIRDCSFPAPGAYEALIFANRELIAQRRFRVIQKESSS